MDILSWRRLVVFVTITIISVGTLGNENTSLAEVNRTLRDQQVIPLQWLLKNGRAKGSLNKNEQDCFDLQKQVYEQALNINENRNKLTSAAVHRMTFNLSNISGLIGTRFKWNVHPGRGVYGGNYLIVPFSFQEKCEVTSLEDINTAIGGLSPTL